MPVDDSPPDELAGGQEEPRHAQASAWLKTWGPIWLPLLAPLVLLLIYAWERDDDELEAKFATVREDIERSTKALDERIATMEKKLDEIREGNERRLFRLEGFQMEQAAAMRSIPPTDASQPTSQDEDIHGTELMISSGGGESRNRPGW